MLATKAPKRLGEWAYHEIKELILNNELKPGQNLAIGSLAERLSLSQTPIREALGRLQAEGLIVHTAHKKPRVSEITLEDLIQTYDARKLIEPQLVVILIRSISDDKLLEQAVSQLEAEVRKFIVEELDELNFESYLKIDKQLNELIIQPVQNTLIGDLQLIINERSLRFRSYAERFLKGETNVNNMMRLVSVEHLKIISAILQKNVTDAKAFTLTHLENGKQRAIESIKQSQDEVPSK
jgi:DNA-binding GntR family transcriptional regulator